MSENQTKIAIVGMSGRFPGADSVESLWNDVIEPGAEAISRMEVPDRGVVGYGLLDNPAIFDNDFFDMSPGEARTVTPEHRLFLEQVWAALEDAGIDITTEEGFVSVYASASNHPVSYLRRILEAVDREQIAGGFGVLLGNAMDSLATRVGYKLGLRGECITIQTHCSSSLVAIHLACQSLLTGHSDIAIAGGVSVRASVESDQEAEFAQLVGQEGFILSSEGNCLALLDGAAGTISGDGVGVVVLKMLDDAIRDDDHIYAVIVGTGINNDGRRKVGFTAPSVDGVSDAIEDALAFADLEPDQIGYVECHGTGTDLGDAIELRALRQVFESGRQPSNPLHLGSVKSSVGHLAAGAGVTGIIKAALSIERATLPPLTHASEHQPHSQVRESAVLKLPTSATAWQTPDGELRRAGVSSLGIGGTNVHILLEQAPASANTNNRPARRPASLLNWSAKSEEALEAMTAQLADAFESKPDLHVDDVAHSLQAGRTRFDHRRCAVVSSVSEAATALRNGRFTELPEAFENSPRKTAFVFPGSGAYRDGMARKMLAVEPRFREYIERCHNYLKRRADFDLIQLLERDPIGTHTQLGLQHLQTAIVSVEYALARCLLDWGIEPAAVIGSSLGEYTAACIAGALSIEDTLHLVYHRGELLEQVTGGAMLLVNATIGEVRELGQTGDDIEEAIRVSSNDVIVSGPSTSIESLRTRLEGAGKTPRLLPPNIAYHSAAVEPIREAFLAGFAQVRFSEPSIPVVSNRTGEVIGHDELRQPEYWFDQMRNTVLFQEGLQCLYDLGARLFLEVGPGHGESKFVGLNFPHVEDVVTQPCLAHPKSDKHDWHFLSEAVGVSWLAGHTVDWEKFGGAGSKVSLPTYAFQGKFFYLGDELPRPKSREASVATISDGGIPSAMTGGTELEQRVARIWSEVLGVSDIGVDENFFDLGGDSLQATRVLGRIQSEISPELSVQDIMEHRTVGAIARILQEILGEAAGGEQDEENADYFCAFDLDLGGAAITVYMTREDYDEQGLPEDATNIRILDN